ncbi:MAG: tetratricopeptide repeat protein [Bacteroidales bacterium]
MDQSLKQLVRKYEEMIGQEKSVYFDADQIEAIAYSFESKEDFAEALNVINYGLTLHPGNTTLCLCKAKYLLFLDYTEEAGKLIPLLPEESEEALLVRIEYQFARGEFDLGFALINKQLHASDLSWEFSLDVVNILWGYATYNQIIEFILKALEKLPENRELLSELAAIYQDNQEEEKSIEIYNRLLDQDPFQPEIWKELAKAHSLQKDFLKAIEACDFALAINGDNEEILCYKGYCQYDLGDFKGALETFKDYEQICADKSTAYEFISDCYTKMEMTSDAISYLYKALELKPDNLHLLYQIAFCYQDMGNTPMAKEFLQKGLAIDNNQIEYHALLAELLMQEENYEESFKEYLQASLLEPENVELLASLGDLCERMDRMEEAVGFYEKAHEKKKYDVKILFRLLLGYYAINQPNKALQLSDEISALTEKINEDETDLTEDEKKEIEEATQMVETIKKLLQEIMENKI